MQICDLPTNEKDAVTFFQEKGILLKRRLCGYGHEAKFYFRKQIFCKCCIEYCKEKDQHSCWELICWQSYLL